jgi:N-acetylglucosaminyl-diphospho-decaprenol L-rhamnosyltransferase
MISVVVVNWNSGELLERCVRSLLEHAGDCEIVVVDNASVDGSMVFLNSLPRVISICNATNAGFAAACNAGWRRSAGEFVLFLNPDTRALRGSTGQLAEALQPPQVWAAGGMLVDADGTPQENFNLRRFPTVRSVAADMLFVEEVWPRNPWSRNYRISEITSVSDVEQPAAACLMVRRSALECAGGFDENFTPAWFEDVDLCKRIHDRGGRIVFQPAARFVHHGGFSLDRLGTLQFLQYYGSNRIRYFSKHHGRIAARQVARLVMSGMFLRSLVSLIIPLAPGCSGLAAAKIFWRAGRYFASGGGGLR